MENDIVINTYDADFVPHFAIVIPIHNKSTLSDVVTQVYDKLTKSNHSYIEIVLSGVNGKDQTRELITNLSKKIPLKASISYGKKDYVDEIKDGLRLVSAPYVIFSASDTPIGKEDFDILKEALGNLPNPRNTIISVKRKKRTGSLFNKIFSKIFDKLNSIAFDLPLLNDISSPFKLMSTDLARALVSECKFKNDNFWTELIVRACEKKIKIVEESHYVIISSHQDTSCEKSTVVGVLMNQLIGLVKLKQEISGKSFVTSMLQTKSIKRLITFALVGTTGALITLFFTWLGVNIHLYYVYAAAIGIQISIGWAFLLHDRITFKDKVVSYRLSNILLRYLKYNVSSLGGQTINISTLFILTTFGLFYLHSEMVAIMVAFIFNYTLSRKWVWGMG